MAKSTITYWNTLATENRGRWTPVAGLDGIAEELTLSRDALTGGYTRLTRFCPYHTLWWKMHPYPKKFSS